MRDHNARLELGAEGVAAACCTIQAAESIHFALSGRGAYPLDKLFGDFPLWTNRLLAGIMGIAYLLSAAGEAQKFLEDIEGENRERTNQDEPRPA